MDNSAPSPMLGGIGTYIHHDHDIKTTIRIQKGLPSGIEGSSSTENTDTLATFHQRDPSWAAGRVILRGTDGPAGPHDGAGSR